MSLWALGNIMNVCPLHLEYFIHPFVCISSSVGGTTTSSSSINYLFFRTGTFGVDVLFLLFIAILSCRNVWYGAPVPPSYLEAVASAFTHIVFAVLTVSLVLGMSTFIAPSA